MGRRSLLYLLYTSSVRPPSSTPYFAPTPPPPPFLFRKGYSHGISKGNHGDETIEHERAPSTLEEFKRLMEEKASEGVVSQTVEKAADGAMEVAAGSGRVEPVKESIKKVDGDSQSTK